MKRSMLVLVLIFNFALLGAKISAALAKAPTTAQIVFGASREGNRDLYLMNIDGSEQINITGHPADDIYGAWSPTGEQILFASDRDRFPGSYDLYLMDANGQNVRRVFGKSAHREAPTWSPDGKQIAYMRQDIGERFIYIATSDGRDEERVAIGGSPAWSPDGKEIVCVVKAGQDRWELHILNVRTRQQKVFFPPKAIPTWIGSIPTWSPEGDKLAFSFQNKLPLKAFGNRETIYTVNRDGTGLTQIVNEAGPKAVSPIWSPRGDALLYAQDDGKARWSLQIFKIVLDKEQTEQLTQMGVWNYPADWFDPAYALPVSPQYQLLTTTWGEVKRK